MILLSFFDGNLFGIPWPIWVIPAIIFLASAITTMGHQFKEAIDDNSVNELDFYYPKIFGGAALIIVILAAIANWIWG